MNLKAALRNKKYNKKGSALITVIIVMAFITIIAALAMWTAYMNYYMKVTEMKSNNTFYSAEGVVEQMKVGLQNELSTATSDAYSKVLQRYAEYTEVERNNYFYSEIIKSLRNSLMASAINRYNLGNLVSFINTANTNIAPAVTASTDTDEFNVTIIDNDGKTHHAKITGGSRLLTIEGTKVTLCDVTVEYTDANDYTSIINTDFTLQAPKIDFEDPSNMTSILNYVIVADEHLKGQGTGPVNIMGSVYGGAGTRAVDPTLDPDYRDVTDTSYNLYTDPVNAIAIDGGCDWTFSNAEHLVTGTTIALSRGAKMTTEGATELWTSDIVLGYPQADVKGEILNLDGTSYVADDLTIDDRGSTVKIGGNYYGYGIDNSSSKDSSAILINAKDTTLDMTAVDSLWLAGRSYVATSRVKVADIPSIPVATVENDNVPMSESIAVRGNQIAYLVPYQALAKLNDNSKVTRNPMTKSEYESSVLPYLGNTNFVECDLAGTLLPGTNNYLNSYAASYKKVFAHGLNGEYLVYYYMDMSPGTANTFFADYYGVESNKTNIDKYVRLYTKDGGIRTKNPGREATETDPGVASEFTRIDVAGNWLTWDGHDDDIVKFNKPRSTMSNPELASEALNNKNSYVALNAKLTKNLNRISAEELTKRPFENLVDETKLPSAVTTFIYKDDTGNQYKGIAVNGDYSYSASPSENIRMIIASGDVTLNSNFDGTILCKQTVEVKPGVSAIRNDSDIQTEVVYALNGRTDPDDTSLDKMLVILKDGAQYDLGDPSEEEEAVTSMDDLVNYENWTKR